MGIQPSKSNIRKVPLREGRFEGQTPLRTRFDLCTHNRDARSDSVWKLQNCPRRASDSGLGMVGLGCMPPAGQALPTFHGKVYVVKKARKSSDLPASMTNASAAQRRIIEPDAERPKAERNSRCAREELCNVNAEVNSTFKCLDCLTARPSRRS